MNYVYCTEIAGSEKFSYTGGFMTHEEYTPTTDDIRSWYSKPGYQKAREAGFDRWLNEQLAEAWDMCVDCASDMLSERKVNELRWLNPYRKTDS